jgi:hypothetical protein
MGEVVYFDVAIKPSASPPPPQTQRVPYEIFVAYRQAERAFKALYFGSPFGAVEGGSSEIEGRHWPTVQKLAETLLRNKSLSRAQVLRVLLQASCRRRRENPSLKRPV